MTKQERDTSDIPKGYNPVSSDDAGTRPPQQEEASRSDLDLLNRKPVLEEYR